MISHSIVFNIREGATHGDCLSVMERGREQLLKIPGVKDFTFSVAVDPNARYQYNLIVYFKDESVIDSYKHHPIHVDYADQFFRPLATDRLTIDYRLID